MKNLIASVVIILLLTAPAVAQQRRASSNPSAKGSRGAPARVPPRAHERHVTTASHMQPEVVYGGEYVEGSEYIDGGHIVDPGPQYTSSCDSCGGGGCDACSVGGSFCGGCNAPHRFCICFPSHGWVHAEYLLWWQSGMRLPPLVTTSPAGTARSAAGVLDRSTTTVLYGDEDDFLSDSLNGVRIRFGWWLSSFPCWGIEGEYVGLEQEQETFFSQSTGNPILARPFFNALEGAEDSELIAFPGVVSGSIAVNVDSQFTGAGVRLRRQLCSSSGCCFSEITCRSVPYSSRLDANIGYRYWELDESLEIQEQLQLQGTESGSFDIVDRYATRNQFNGTELGFQWQGRRGCWTADALLRVAIGNVHQTVTISGTSRITENGASSNFDQGFLTQRTNIGTYDRDEFTMVPELGATLGYQLTRRLRATAGYSAIYWGNVVRPGDQVDLDVNPNLLPPEVDPLVGPLRPQFQFRETDYWVHGLSFGAEFRW